MTSSTASTTYDPRQSLELIEIKPGVKFSLGTLIDLLPDAETLLFFAKVYGLDYKQLSSLMAQVLNSDVATELFRGDHSTDLQGYLIGGYEHDEDCAAADWEGRECTCVATWHEGIVPAAKRGDVTLKPDVPTGEILPEVWKSLQTEVAGSIKAVAAKLESVVGLLPGKQGSMVFNTMMKMNAKRPTFGVHQAGIHHAPQKQNLLIFDVSGSMTRGTVEKIIEDVVALSYTANTHMAVVSNTTTYWEAGSFDVADVLRAAEFGGTCYETLEDVLANDWGTVITIADYDSSYAAKDRLAQCKGRIDEVLDISLVYRPTFLAECVGQLATTVRPLLIAEGSTPRQLR